MAAAALLALNALELLALRQIKNLERRMCRRGAGSIATCNRSISAPYDTCIGAPKVGAGL